MGIILEGVWLLRISGGLLTGGDGVGFKGFFFNHFLLTRKVNMLNNVTVRIADTYIILKKQIYEAKQ